MKEFILPIQKLLAICTKENVRSAKTLSVGAILPSLLWACDAKRVLEIGTLEGFTALAIGMQLELMDGPRSIVIADLQERHVTHSFNLIKKYAPGIRIDTFTGDTAAANWGSYLPGGGARFDFAYIDGNHSYEGVLADLELVSPWITAHGLMLLHDYIKHPKCGIVQAVQDFTQEFPGWNYLPIPVGLGAPIVLLGRDAPDGLPMGKRGRIDGV